MTSQSKDVEETQMKELKRWQQRQKWRQWMKMEEEQVQRRLELGPEFLILESLIQILSSLALEVLVVSSFTPKTLGC